MSPSFAFTTLICILSVAQLVQAGPEYAKFKRLPNATRDMPSDSYSGYLNISETKKLHYVFVESLSNPKTDPLLVWFNGGPGCSSLFGFMQEHGPFKIDDGKTEVEVNRWPWNLNASVLYLESPAGVGFSTVTDYKELFYSDTSVARDAMKAVRIWYEEFPEFGWNRQNNPLYITGESYGGLYVPYLSWQIYLNNLKADVPQTGLAKYNLKGFIVANGVTDVFSDSDAVLVENLYRFNVIPAEWYQTIKDFNCAGYADAFPSEETKECDAVWPKINKVFDKLNVYDLLRKNYELDEKKGNSTESDHGKAILNGQEVTYKRGVYQNEYTPWLGRSSTTRRLTQHKQYKLFGSTVISDYFNNQTVRDVLHVEGGNPWE